MADPGYVKSLLGGLPADQRSLFGQVFEYVLGNLRVGLPGHQKRAENTQWYELDITTPATANEEFTVAHGLNVVPRVAFPAIDLTTVGSGMATLVTTRAADSKRLYLSSPSTNVALTLFVEGR